MLFLRSCFNNNVVLVQYAALINNVVLVQYADDICIWMPVNLKKKVPIRNINYVRKLYQLELNKLSYYVKENGLQLSAEKTNMVLFNNGSNTDRLPSFQIEGINLQYKQSVKFLGVYFRVHQKHRVLLLKKRK